LVHDVKLVRAPSSSFFGTRTVTSLSFVRRNANSGTGHPDDVTHGPSPDASSVVVFVLSPEGCRI
jgi:hypothetical protein